MEEGAVCVVSLTRHWRPSNCKSEATPLPYTILDHCPFFVCTLRILE